MWVSCLVLCLWAADSGAHVQELDQSGLEVPIVSLPCVIPLLLAPEWIQTSALHAHQEDFVEVAYSLTPDSEPIFEELAERVWWIQDQAMLLLGSTGEPLPSSVRRRAQAYVQIFVQGKPLTSNPVPIFPQRDQVRVQPDPRAVSKMLAQRLDVDATYLSHVANYLAGNLATLEVTATSYAIQGYGTVIDDSGSYVGNTALVSGKSVGFSTSGGTEGFKATLPSSAGLTVDSSYKDGVVVTEAGPAAPIGLAYSGADGFEVKAAEGHGLWVGRVGLHGVSVGEADGNGVQVSNAGSNGLQIDAAAEKGVMVVAAGDSAPPGVSDYGDNGIEVQAAQDKGLFIGRTGESAVEIFDAGTNGVTVQGCGDDGIHVIEAGDSPFDPSSYLSSNDHGVEIQAAAHSGLYVGAARYNGAYVQMSEDDGFSVWQANDNGVQVSNAGDAGVYVGWAGDYGIQVNDAGDNAARLRSNTQGSGVDTATLHVTNASTLAGVGAYIETHGTDAGLVLTQLGSSGARDFFKCFDASFNVKARLAYDGNLYLDGSVSSPAGDIAESFVCDQDPETFGAGDVLVLRAAGEIAEGTVGYAAQAYSPHVLGVYPTKPAVRLRAELDHAIPVGLVGVIPTRVSDEGGLIRIGDLLVTSSTPGCAMKADPDKIKPGMTLGRAMTHQQSPTDVIDVLVGR